MTVARQLDDIIKQLAAMPAEERAAIEAAAEQACDGMLWVPNPGPQTMAYFSPADVLFFGGEPGGGKSDLMLGLALNEHTKSQIFRLHHGDRLDLIERLAQILGSRDGYNGSDHVWRVANKVSRLLEFGALSDPKSWQKYQGRPADLKAWDELPQFQESQFRTVNGWNRTTIKGQRCRVVAAGNPPLTPEGLWVVEYFAPWLDEHHENPAADGELRWFTRIKGKEEEVSEDWRGVDKNGLELKPKSRTFIRSTLADNPDLAETDYASQLASLPGPLAALAEGKFSSAFDDAAWQVIPTDWVLTAQQRWAHKKVLYDEGVEQLPPMTAMGVDVAMGGADRLVLAPRYGTFFDELIEVEGVNIKNPRDVAAMFFAHVSDDAQANVDCTGGWGSGVIEHLESNRHPCVKCVFSQQLPRRTSRHGDVFVNRRAEYYWRLRESLHPDTGDDLALPPGRQLLAELTAPRWVRKKVDGRNAIQIEEKDKIAERIGRSPDLADALVLAWAERDALSNILARQGFHGPGGLVVNRANAASKEKSRRWRGKSGKVEE